MPIVQMISPLLHGVSNNCAEFWHFTHYLAGHTGQKISHCGSCICLGNCMLVPSTDMILLSPPNIIDPSPNQNLFGCSNITSSICTATQPHCNGLQCITYFLNVFTFCEDQQSVLFITFLLPLALVSYAHRLPQQ